jgi:1-acyl-sn-glycerol-3-phosphate acyltransferase
MKANFYGPFFRALQNMAKIIYPKYTVHIPNHVHDPVVYVSHHQNLFGPFVILLWFPKSLHAWILQFFLDQKACYQQYVDYTFTKRFGWNKRLAKICAFPISFFIAALLNSGKGIPVHRGSRKILDTFKLSVTALSKGESIVIFPDMNYRDDSASTKEMYEGFLYLEKYYYKATGKHVCFVPLYASRSKHLIIAEEQIYFRERIDYNIERKIVYEKIHHSLNELAKKCRDC